MFEFHKALSRRRRQIEVAAATAALWSAVTGCAPQSNTAANQSHTTLNIGYAEYADVGIEQAVRNIAFEGLVRIDRDGRPKPWLAAQWSSFDQGLAWRLRLQSGATFHDGQPVTAAAVRDIVERNLPGYLGPTFEDVERIRASGPYELEFVLKRRSTFLFEGLDVLIERPGKSPIGTGPFFVVSRKNNEVEMRANVNYYGGTPSLDRVVFRPYASVRSAWADMLRNRVDMLYEVGIDALDSLKRSTQTKIFTFERPYAFVVILNTTRPNLREKKVRRDLNAAIDRVALVAEALNNQGTPAEGPVWPHHWAYGRDLPRFQFQPQRIESRNHAIQVKCLIVPDQSHERVGLAIQRQLRAVGVDLMFEQLSPAQIMARLQASDFDAVLGDPRMGPSLLQQYLLWYSRAPNNWGHFSSSAVDQALDRIRGAADDEEYRAGVADFQRAIVDDPPAIFLAWSERLRAVSTRFDVHSEPGRDILIAPMLRLWRPATDVREVVGEH